MHKNYTILQNFFSTILVAIFALGINVYADSLSDIYDDNPNVANCERGELNEIQRQLILNEVNRIRAIHKLQPVTYNYSQEAETQQGALMCCANNDIDHQPPSSWECYTSDGYSGTENSNLYISWRSGSNLPSSVSSIESWMIDSFTSSLGHRQAIINPFVENISFGRVDGKPKVTSTYPENTAMALQYRGSYRSNINVDYIACPYENYPPEYFQNDWLLSFSAFYDKSSWWNNGNIDPTDVTIEVTVDGSGQKMTVSNIQFDNQGWGSVMNCLKWQVSGMQDEVKYNVSIKNLKVNGVSKDYSYWFKLTDSGSTEEPPAAPALAAPANASNDLLPPQQLSWNASVGAEEYHLQISESSNFNTTVVDEEGLTTTTYDFTEFDEDETYYWRVSASNNVGEGDWSDTWSFSSMDEFPKTPDAPGLASPDNGAEIDVNKVTLEWDMVDDLEDYRLQTAFDRDMENIAYDKEVTFNKKTLMGLQENTTYWWRVAAINNVGQGEWSDIRSFVVMRSGDVDEEYEKYAKNVSVYPNPVTGTSTIKFITETHGNVKIDLYNALGEHVKMISAGLYSAGEHSIDFNSEGLPAGVYFFRVNTNDYSISKIMEVL